MVHRYRYTLKVNGYLLIVWIVSNVFSSFQVADFLTSRLPVFLLLPSDIQYKCATHNITVGAPRNNSVINTQQFINTIISPLLISFHP